jgi:hypothetical protein
MTRKHFEAIARTIRELPEIFDAPHRVDRLSLREKIATEFADLCAGYNGRFDRERFMEACRNE